MSNNTRIYNRWQGYTLDDCARIYCVNYAGKDQPCPLEVCCCTEERCEAFLREYGYFVGTLPDKDASAPCLQSGKGAEEIPPP